MSASSCAGRGGWDPHTHERGERTRALRRCANGMGNWENRAEKFREFAAELRRKASAARKVSDREDMLLLATEYDLLAAGAEQDAAPPKTAAADANPKMPEC